MRIILYLLVIAAVLLIPVECLDVAKLQPVETVAVYMDRGCVILKTDEGSAGKGKTALEALEDLKENTPAVVYLDTADYLLIGGGAEEAAQQLMPYLKKSVKTDVYHGGDVKEEGKLLDVHMDTWKPEK